MTEHFEEETLESKEFPPGNAFLAPLRSFEAEDVLTMLDDADVLLANINTSARAITWDRIKAMTNEDSTSKDLIAWIMDGCSEAGLNQTLKPYWNVRKKLRVTDGVPMLDDRTIIPMNLRQEVIDTLHSAHRNSMIMRASDIVYWPGYWLCYRHREETS